ncbi:MAG: GIY-YIG nuclease family protein [Anaerolineales bacterium]
MPYYCYIVECADGTYYTGWTTDPARREKQHNAGQGARYTRMKRPVRLVYIEEQPDKITALKRERAIKVMTRGQKQKLVESAHGQG